MNDCFDSAAAAATPGPGEKKEEEEKQNSSKVSVFESVGSERTKSSNPLKADFFDQVKFFLCPSKNFLLGVKKNWMGRNKKIKKLLPPVKGLFCLESVFER